MLHHIRLVVILTALVLTYALNSTVAWAVLAGLFAHVVSRRLRSGRQCLVELNEA
ncbi:MAG: hypothetical protein ACRD3C_23380 [Vicinamibacterales bacterium]